MSQSHRIGGALAALLLIAAPDALAQTQTINFTTLGTFTTPDFVSGHLSMTADDGVNPALINILNLNGLGVAGSPASSLVDGIEAVHFSYDVPVIDVAYTVFVANNGDGDGLVGEGFVEAFDGATSLGVVAVNDTGFHYVSQLFGGVPITGFTLRADHEGVRIDTTTYTVNPWATVGPGLAGSQGVGVLTGTGTLKPDTPLSVTATNLRQNHVATLVLGFSLLHMPFKGGVLGPDLGILINGLPTGPLGQFTLGGTYPAGVPSGVSFYTQVWWSDPAGVLGAAATNTLSGTSP